MSSCQKRRPLVRLNPFADEPNADVWLPGPDGRRLKELLADSMRIGVVTLTNLAAECVPDAVALILSGRPPTRLFNDRQSEKLTDALASLAGCGELLGRTRIRELYTQAALNAVAKFDDIFGVRLPFFTPERAAEFFRSVVPGLALDLLDFVKRMTAQAARLAEYVEAKILRRIKNHTGEIVRQKKPVDLKTLLDKAGLLATDPRYAQFVFRTAVLEHFNDGSTMELASPDVRDVFPVWHYTGIHDDRTGKDHWPLIDKYYPNTVTFREVRGPRIWNCRCGFVPVDRWAWAELRKKGARLQTSFVRHVVGARPARNVAGTDWRKVAPPPVRKSSRP